MSVDIKSNHKTFGMMINALWLGQEIKSCFLAALLGDGVPGSIPHIHDVQLASTYHLHVWRQWPWIPCSATRTVLEKPEKDLHVQIFYIFWTLAALPVTQEKLDSFFSPFSLSLRIIPEWWVQSLMLSAWIILPTWQHQQIWGEVGIMVGLFKSAWG